MKAPVWTPRLDSLEGVASGTHYTQEQLRASDSHSTQPKIIKVLSTTCASRIRPNIITDQYIPVHTGLYQCVLVYTFCNDFSIFFSVLVHPNTYQYVLVCTAMLLYILGCTNTYQYEPVCTVHTSMSRYQCMQVWTSMYWYTLVYTSIYCR